MIDTNAQRAECARMQQKWRHYFGQMFQPPQTGGDPCTYLFANEAAKRWPALIKAHREALDEIDRLRQVNAAYLESHLSGMDLAQQREQEIERLRADLLRENSAGETHRQECERLRAAGKVLARGTRLANRMPGTKEEQEKACRVFEEGE